MGISKAAIQVNLELWQRGLLKDVRSVVELGSQELTLKPAEFEALLGSAGIQDYPREAFRDLANFPGFPRVSAAEFYKLLGIDRYACVDINGEHGALRLDLNLPLEDRSLFGRFDMVTDHGSAEHAFNIAEAYRTLHRLCRPQGLITVCQAVWGGNGYFLFDLSFFEGIAAANGYSTLFSSYFVTMKPLSPSGDLPQFHIPLSRELLQALDLTKISALGICYVMRKQADQDFKFPYQGPFLSRAQGNIGYQLQFLPSPPSRTYVPMYSLDGVPVREQLGALRRKLLRRVKASARGMIGA